MTVELPEIESLQLTPDEARLELAVGLYAGHRVTLGGGAGVAGVSQADFLREIGRRGIALHYTEADARQDVALVNRLGAKA